MATIEATADSGADGSLSNLDIVIPNGKQLLPVTAVEMLSTETDEIKPTAGSAVEVEIDRGIDKLTGQPLTETQLWRIK